MRAACVPSDLVAVRGAGLDLLTSPPPDRHPGSNIEEQERTNDGFCAAMRYQK